jgi:hypothetical protein
MLSLGMVPPTLWINHLKDERRPIERVTQGKTRTFCLGPVDSTIVGRKYFMDIVAAMESKPTSSFCAVGIDPASYDWTSLYNRLSSKSPTGFDIDYSSYDGSIPAEFMIAVAHVCNRWYAHYYPGHSAEDERARLAIFEEVIHTFNLSINAVYQKHRGNPSGFFMTTILNTIVGYLLMNYAWRYLIGRNGKTELLPRMLDFVAPAIYGDDNIAAVNEGVQQWFDLGSIANVMKTIGLTCTSADKTETKGFRNISDLSFLKRTFLPHPKHPQIKLAPIAPQTIRELPMWQHSGAPPSQLSDNIRDALLFAYHHGPKFYNTTKQDISRACTSNSLPQYIPTLSYSDADSLYLSRIFPLEPLSLETSASPEH